MWKRTKELLFKPIRISQVVATFLIRLTLGIVSSVMVLVGLLLISPFNLPAVGLPMAILGLYLLKKAIF